MRPGYYPGWDDNLGQAPSAPPLPSESHDEYSDVPAPQWVQRIYGPPPTHPAPSNLAMPADMWGAAGAHPAQPPQQPWGAPSPLPVHYDVRAYTPGVHPHQLYQTPGAGLRARSPSAATFTTNGGGSSQSSGHDSGAGAPPQQERSPTKTPLLLTEGKGGIALGGGDPSRNFGEDATMPSK